MTRYPHGYVGSGHETIGSDIIAVLKAIHLPEATLGKELATQLAHVKAEQWYPISLLLEALEALDPKLDEYALRNVGWQLFKMSHEAAVRKNFHSARALLHAFDAVYKSANRGEAIGGWKVVKFEPGLAELEKTTPHHCLMEEGLIQEALRVVGVSATVTQSRCFRKGSDRCLFVIKSAVVDERWGGPS